MIRFVVVLVLSLLLWLPGTTYAAFPTVAAVLAGDDNGVLTTSRDIPLAAGTSAGNLLLVVASCRASTLVIGWPGDWTQLVHTTQSESSSRVWLDVYYKIAEGDETTVTVTSSSANLCAWVAYRITGFDSGTAPVAAPSSGANPSSPNPPSLSPPWGAADTLWLAVGGWPNLGGVTTFSTNYTNTQVETTSGASTSVGVGSGQRQLNASTENPTEWTLVSTGNVSAATVAIPPVPSGGGGQAPRSIHQYRLRR